MRRVKQVVRGIAVAGVFVLTLELAARVDDHLTWGAPLWSRYTPDLLRSRGPDGIPRNVPGAQFEKWRINSLGFRGPEVERDRIPGSRRILVLGQSESFGLYESEGGEWPERLRKLAEVQSKGVQIVNASVVGTRRWSRQAYLENYLFPLQPDVVILLPNVYNEASDDIVAPRAAGAVKGRTPEEDPGNGFRLRVLPKLRLKAREALPDGLVAAWQGWKLRRELRVKQESAPEGQVAIDRVPEEATSAYRAYLRGLVELLRSRGVAPVLATCPTLVHPENRDRNPLPLLAQRVYHFELSEDGLLDAAARYNDTIRITARELGVPLVDLEATIPKTTDYFVDQVHFTDKGAQLAAEHALRVLVGSRLIE